VDEQMRAARRIGAPTCHCSLDLQRSSTTVELNTSDWAWQGEHFPYPESCKDRTVYYWDGETFQPLARYTTSLIKLVPTQWGPPTFEIDGIKMLPTSRISPYVDAQQKVALIRPLGKVVLDTCGGLGYFAAWCLHEQAAQVLSFEKNADVIWLRGMNPWSPETGGALRLTHGDISEHIATLPSRSVDAILHDPPRIGIAGDLYSRAFYEQLARVLKPRGQLFHYTGTPNKLTSGRDVPGEVVKRLRAVGFAAQLTGGGVLAVNRS
jgi:predicted methyltransferase